MTTKPYIGQVIHNDQGRIMGKVIRIHRPTQDTTILYYVPVMTPIGFGKPEHFYDCEGNQLQ